LAKTQAIGSSQHPVPPPQCRACSLFAAGTWLADLQQQVLGGQSGFGKHHADAQAGLGRLRGAQVFGVGRCGAKLSNSASCSSCAKGLTA
jgi:hypothetical protein